MIGVDFWRKLYRRVSTTLRSKTGSSVNTAESGGGTELSSRSQTDTEYTAEVVRVTRVLPHPNADRLEILRFEMSGIGETAYEVVSQKGSLKIGDVASYFSVDCLLPTSHPDFRFLTERLDGKGKDVYRLRAARLRGVFSQGLLVPLEKINAQGDTLYDYGEQIADRYGVTYHRAPETGSSTQVGQHKLSARPQPFPIYTVDSLKKLPRLFEEGERVTVTEKIHGTNFRFGWVPRKVLGIRVGWKFVVGSHRTVKVKGDGSYYGEDLYTRAADAYGLAEKTKLYRGHTFYGELYGLTYGGGKIQDLTYDRKDTGLVIFDVLDDKKQWLDVWTRRNLCADLDLVHVPIISNSDALSTMSFDLEEIQKLSNGKSLLAHNQIREGVVVESTEGVRRKAKFVGQDYLMRKEQS